LDGAVLSAPNLDEALNMLKDFASKIEIDPLPKSVQVPNERVFLEHEDEFYFRDGAVPYIQKDSQPYTEQTEDASPFSRGNIEDRSLKNTENKEIRECLSQSFLKVIK
jgi:hypothetical protein